MGYPFGPGAYGLRGDKLVRLDPEFQQCVVWIGTAVPGTTDEINPWGTGFLVFTSAPQVTYLVTAAHVVSDSQDAPFDVRFNTKTGGARNHHIDTPNWVFHPTDNTVDVAVHEIEVPDWAEYRMIPKVPTLLMPDRMESKNIGSGDNTYTIGIWKFLIGKRRNQAFVYSGHIGLIPDEKIAVRPWLKRMHGKRVLVEAYLVEGEPLDGASGSPVFVARSLTLRVAEPMQRQILEGTAQGSLWLLGLQSDCYVGEPGVDYQIPTSGHVTVPRGVNVVVPSTRISEVLDHPKLIKDREAKRASAEARSMPIKTGSLAPVPIEPAKADANPNHKEDFTSLLSAASKKSQPAD
jgi:hypothetical protein